MIKNGNDEKSEADTGEIILSFNDLYLSFRAELFLCIFLLAGAVGSRYYPEATKLLMPAHISERASDFALAALFGVWCYIAYRLLVRNEVPQTGFRNAAGLEQVTGVTVIGQIPRAPTARRKRILDYIVSKPTSELVESVRNLRTSILLSNVDKPPQVIMLTSSVPGEGKTTQSLALAHNLAGMGRKVLIIEGDIRRRTFREYFDIQGKSGLLAAVSGEKPLEDVVWHDEKLGVDILIGEQSAINAADFFSSNSFAAFLETVRKAYDVVLIDTPPVLIVPDARVIAQHADAVVYVVHWDRTPRSQVEQGLHAFATVNVPVTGLVLCQVARHSFSLGYFSTRYYSR